jgi:hypothetical protein
LNEKDLNIEAKQLNNDENEEENAAESCSDFAAKNR